MPHFTRPPAPNDERRAAKHALVQLDCDPMERINAIGQLRVQLNLTEAQILERRAIARRMVDLFFTQEKEMPAVLEELRQEFPNLDADYSPNRLVQEFLAGRSEYEPADPQAQRLYLQRTADYFLHRFGYKTRKEIALALGLNLWQLKEVARSEEFLEIWRNTLLDLSSAPEIPTAQQKIVTELLPQAVRLLEQELTDPEVPWSIRDKAVERVMKLAGVEAIQPRESDRQEAAKFLAAKNVRVELVVPQEYLDALAETRPDVVEGQIRNAAPELPAGDSAHSDTP